MTDQEILTSVNNTWQAEEAAIARLRSGFPEEAILAAVKMLGDCGGRILVSGCGTSAAAAKKVAHTLCCVERPAAFLSPSDAAHGALGLLQRDDVLILISKGGGTGELLNLIPACRAKGARLIGVTENPDSPLGIRADLVLPVRVEREPCPFNMLATASTLAVIAVFDAISIALMSYTGYTREQFAIIHPGGAVGDRLQKKEGNA